MTEAELTRAVLALCDRHGALSHFCPDSRRCKGRRGFPDVPILGTRGMVLAELKADDGQTSADQDLWHWTAHQAGVPYRIWRPADLRSGLIERAIEELA